MNFCKVRIAITVLFVVCTMMIQGCGIKSESVKSLATQTDQSTQKEPTTVRVDDVSGNEAGQAGGNKDSTEDGEGIVAESPTDERGGEKNVDSEGGTSPSSGVVTPPREESSQDEYQQNDKETSDKIETHDGKTKDGSHEDNSYSLADKLILPLTAVTVVLVGVVGWLIYDRKKRQINPSVNVSSTKPHDYSSNIYQSTPEQFSSTTFGAADGTIRSSQLEIRPIFRIGCLHQIGRRTEQQDSFCVSNVDNKINLYEKGLLAVVADGMGGLDNGSVISKLVSDTMRNSYLKSAIENPAQFLYSAAEEAEKATVSYMRRMKIRGGSTLVSVLIKGHVLSFISVGDSRIYLLRDGQLKQLNREHTYGEVLRMRAKRGEVSQDAPFKDPDRHKLVAYIGMGSFNTVDRGEINLQLGDRILLSSDGVFNALGDDALIAALSTGDAETAARRIEEAVLTQAIPDQDNFTGVIIEYVS